MHVTTWSRRRRSLAAVLALVAGSGLAVAAARAPARVLGLPPDAAPLRQVIVTDINPEDVLADRTVGPIDAANFGPFDARATLEVYIVAIYDRTRVGRRPFEQRLRLVLPDGHVYEDRTLAVDPRSEATRADVAPGRTVAGTPRLRRFGRALPHDRVTSVALREATYTTEKLLVSGTWITQHNLYGEWTAELAMVRDGEILSRTATTFRLDRPH